MISKPIYNGLWGIFPPKESADIGLSAMIQVVIFQETGRVEMGKHAEKLGNDLPDSWVKHGHLKSYLN